MVAAISPTFGGINLEDIKAPECFYIEETLKGMLDIPVFHDDQHGTAIISGAALLNGLEVVGKRYSPGKDRHLRRRRFGDLLRRADDPPGARSARTSCWWIRRVWSTRVAQKG